MKVFVQGVGEVNLTQRDFIAQGGEGAVYGKKNVAYKVYADPTKMIPVAKIQELSCLSLANIVKPEKLLLDAGNQTIGHTMKKVEGLPLCQYFTKAFKQRHSLTEKEIIHLMKEIQKIVDHVHKHNILIVDLNELNFLVKEHKEVFAIDVNSYQTPSFPATVIMPSIADRHCNNKFNKNTDWFSWGIISFQMLMGIHPYKGKCAKYENLPIEKRIDMRMRENVSIFNKEVTYPNIVPPFDIIPAALRSWYKAVFEEGKRLPPPTDYEVVTNLVAQITKIIGNDVLDVKELETFNQILMDYYSVDGNRAFLFENKVIYSGKTYPKPHNAKIIFSKKMNHPILVYVKMGKTSCLDLVSQQEYDLGVGTDHLMQVDDRIYIHSGTYILEVIINELNSIHISTKVVGNVLDLPNATQVFDGTICQNMLGRYYFSFFPTAGKSYQIPFKELDDCKILDAKYCKKVLVVMASKKGVYNRFVFRIDDNFEKYDCRQTENVPFEAINFTVNDAGITVLITEDEKLEAFSNKINSASVKMIENKLIETDMRLTHDGVKICFMRDKQFYSMSIK